MLAKEKIDFHLLMALAFHDLPRKKSDQLVVQSLRSGSEKMHGSDIP